MTPSFLWDYVADKFLILSCRPVQHIRLSYRLGVLPTTISTDLMCYLDSFFESFFSSFGSLSLNT